MCGIAGYSLRPGARPPTDFLRKAAAALSHRGPDGTGFFEAEGVGLAHTRLSIIDIEGGAQPLFGPEERMALVANGEIYNYTELRAAAERSGFGLRTHSDSETALYAYAERGLDFAKMLRGMYAIALWDGARLALARDPFGIKPLYLAENALGVAFASEPSALIAAGWLDAALEPRALRPYFNRRYVRGRRTLFAGIERVAPGETLAIAEGRVVERARREPDLPAFVAIEEKEALAELDRLLRQSVLDHMQSDAPYGAFLSGGLDSGAVVTLMAELGQPPKAFTIGFASNAVADESAEARRLAEKAGADHRVSSMNEADFWARLPEFALSFDDLVADWAAVALLALAENAAPSVKVALSGEGGDEVFGGYGRYTPRLKNLFREGGFRGPGELSDAPRLFAPLPEGDIEPPTSAFRREGYSRLQARQGRDFSDWLPDDLLTKVDRCLMRHGIEGRVPMLDDRLAAFGFSLPDRLKRRGKREGKWLLRRWLADRDAGVDPWARKRGFDVPAGSWIDRRRADVGRYLAETPALRDLLDRTALSAMFARPIAKSEGGVAFGVLAFALWSDAHLLGDPRCERFRSCLGMAP